MLYFPVKKSQANEINKIYQQKFESTQNQLNTPKNIIQYKDLGKIRTNFI